MSKSLLNNLPNLTSTPQREQAREDQVKNNAGGFVFQLGTKKRLERFLVLGIDGGTFYVSEKDLFKTNYTFIVEQVKSQPFLVLHTAVEVSAAGRAYRNDAAVFVLALLFRYAPEGAKTEIRSEFNQIVRTSYHLYRYCEYIEKLRDGTDGGWSRSTRRAVGDWYIAKLTANSADLLGYQFVKYRQRDGWAHRDVLRLAHPQGLPSSLTKWVLGKDLADDEKTQLPFVVQGFELAQGTTELSELLTILDVHQNLPWEAVPTKFHKNVELWKKLFSNGQLKGQALLRNITRLARLGAFDDMVFAADVARALADEEMIKA